MKYSAVFFLLLAIAVQAQADAFYRETFNFCDKPTSRPSAQLTSGWKALTTGHKAGKPSILKIQPVGASSRLPAIASDPEGPLDGNGYWGRTSVTRGLLLFTDEVQFEISDLSSVTWQQRLDRQDKPFENYGARLAFLIGGYWYISEYSATQRTRGVFEKRKLSPTATTYGIAPNTPGIGIAAPQSYGHSLPGSGTVTAVGLFLIRAYAKVRIDDFTLRSNAPSDQKPTRDYARCPGITSDPNIAADEDTEPNAAPKPQCADGLDNDADTLVDSADPGCKSAVDNTEAGGIPPAAPENFSASDSESSELVRLSWKPVSGALYYRIYRSQFSSAAGEVLAPRVDVSEFEDRSAVPGVSYYYWATALNQYDDESLPSAPASGRRYAPLGDNDGDGVSNAQELLDETNPHDPGSYRVHLRSPAFSKYNTYLGQWNFLELAASGSKTVGASISMLALGGEPIATTTVQIPPHSEVDLDLNRLLLDGCTARPDNCAGLGDLDGTGLVDTYGVVRIDFNDSASDPGADLTGRVSNYRLNPDNASFSFALARELRNPSRGTAFAPANTYDPQQRGFLVPNWLEVSNLEGETRDFEYLLWAQDGSLISRQSFSVPPFGERDMAAGHQIANSNGRVREGVYLVELRPRDGAANYLASVSRYSSNAPPGFSSQTYNYAFSAEAVPGNGSAQFVPIFNLRGACYLQTNWLEVTNVRELPVSARLTIRGAGGQVLNSGALNIGSKAQLHINTSALLPSGATGSVEVSSEEPSSIAVQSVVYYHDCRSNLLQTAFALQGRSAGQDVQTGSVNTYNGSRSMLYLLSTAANTVPVAGTWRAAGMASVQGGSAVELTPRAVGLLSLLELPDWNLSSEQYGAMTLQSSGAKAFVAWVLRTRESASGEMDFVMPTTVR